MYVGIIKEIKQYGQAIVCTEQSLDLLGRGDRRVYLPISQIQIKKDSLGRPLIYIPDWLVTKDHIVWGRLKEIEPLTPKPNYTLLKQIGGRNYDYH